MTMKERYKELTTAIGTWPEVTEKVNNAWTTISNTFNRGERRRRLEYLLEQGHIDDIPNEWQIFQASQHMLLDYIIPSNGEFYEHYDQNQYWLQFLRVLDEPSAMMDPTGLAVSKEMIVQHLLHVVHCTAGYDVGLLHMFPNGIEALEEQLQLYVDGKHPRQSAIQHLIERQSYPQELLEALQLYKADPEKYWEIYTFETPEGCDELFEFGVERFGTLGRLLNYACTLPPSPWESFHQRFLSKELSQAA